MEKISIIVPVFNEEWCIIPLFEKIRRVAERDGWQYEVIFVNDGSSDGTLQRMQDLQSNHGNVKAVSLKRNFGITASLMAGIDHSCGGIIVTMDGNLQNDPEDLPAMLAKIAEGCDVCVGWRKRGDKDTLRRDLPGRLMNIVISRLSSLPLHDFGCSLRVCRRSVLAEMKLYGEAHRLIPVFANLQGAQVAEVPVRQYPRAHGHGSEKDRFKRVVKVVLDLILLEYLFRYAMRPMYLFGMFGLVNFGISAIAAFVAIYYKFFGGKSLIETPLPLLFAMTVFAGVICILMGFLAEVVVRIYYEAQNKPIYVLDKGNCATRE